MNADTTLTRELFAVHVRTATSYRHADRTGSRRRLAILPLIAGVIAIATTAAAASFWV